MAMFFMFGKYSGEALKSISAKRTEQASTAITELGGELESAYALLGEYDLVLITTFPGTEQALKASIAIQRLTGISFTTSPAFEVGDFDKLAATI